MRAAAPNASGLPLSEGAWADVPTAAKRVGMGGGAM